MTRVIADEDLIDAGTGSPEQRAAAAERIAAGFPGTTLIEEWADPDDLSAAWKAVEEVLPEGEWVLEGVVRIKAKRYRAVAAQLDRYGYALTTVDCLGPTPTAALLALRDRLTDTGKENRE